MSPRTLHLGRSAPICIAAARRTISASLKRSVAPDDLRQSNPVRAPVWALAPHGHKMRLTTCVFGSTTHCTPGTMRAKLQIFHLSSVASGAGRQTAPGLQRAQVMFNARYVAACSADCSARIFTIGSPS